MVLDDDCINTVEAKSKLDYMKELLIDKTLLSSDSNRFHHLHKILDKEILSVRSGLFSMYGIHLITDSDLPEVDGPKINMQTKVYMPVDSNNYFNFVGRILGPDGSTAKCLQQCLGVKIMVRGRGSMRDRRKEEANIGKPKWEHLSDNLHVVLTVEDSENRGKVRLAKASECIKLFLNASMKPDREDKVKQMQLMELAFRRERQAWQFNCTDFSQFAIPTKPSHMFHNANLMNFGYGYPAASFYPSLTPHHPAPSHNPVGSGTATATLGSHHHHTNLSHGQQATNVQLGSLQHVTGSNQQHPFVSPLSPNLGTTMFVGHGPGPHGTAAFHTGSYSPNSQGMQLPGSLAVASMNYWTPATAPGQLTTVPPEYHVLSQYTQQQEHQNQQQTNVSCGNEFATPSSAETSSSEPAVTNTSTSLTNASHLPLTTVYMTPTRHPTSHQVATLQDEQLQPSLIPNFQLCNLADCSLASGRDYDANTPMMIHPGFTGLYGQLPQPMVTNANKVQQAQPPILGLNQTLKTQTGLLSVTVPSSVVTNPSSSSNLVASSVTSKSSTANTKTRQSSQKQAHHSVTSISNVTGSTVRTGRVSTTSTKLRLDVCPNNNNVQANGINHSNTMNVSPLYNSKSSQALTKATVSCHEFIGHNKKDGSQLSSDMSQTQTRIKGKGRVVHQRINTSAASESCANTTTDGQLRSPSLDENEAEWPKLGSSSNKQQIKPDSPVAEMDKQLLKLPLVVDTINKPKSTGID